MINSGGVPSDSSGGTGKNHDPMQLIENLEHLLDQSSSMLEYVAQKYEETILGSRPVIDQDTDEESNKIKTGENKLKTGLDSLVTRILQPRIDTPVGENDADRYDEEPKETLSIRSTEHSLKSAPLQTLAQRSMRKKANYLGEMNRNLRNGLV